MQGRDEDAVASADFSTMLSEEEKEELKAELVQVCLVIFLLLLLLFLDRSETLVGFFLTKSNANPILVDLYTSLIGSTKIKGILKLPHEEMIK